MIEIAGAIVELNIVLALAVLATMAIRSPALKLFGAEAAYLRWLLVPLAMLAIMLPEPIERIALPEAIGIATVPLGEALPGIELAQADTVGTAGGLATWPLVLLIVWLVGVAMVATAIYGAQRKFRASLAPMRADKTYGPGVFRTARDIPGPFLIDLSAPRIVLPTDFEKRYDETERDLVILHERQHIHRRDLHAIYAASVLLCLCWFNPFAYLGWAQLRRDQEIACDAAITRQRPEARRAYGMALLRTARSEGTTPLACTLHRRSALGERIGQISRRPVAAWRKLAGSAAMLALTGSGTALAWTQQPGAGSSVTAAPTEPRMLAAGAMIDGFSPTGSANYRDRDKIVLDGAILVHLVSEDRDDIAIESASEVTVGEVFETLYITGNRHVVESACDARGWPKDTPVIRLRTPQRVKLEIRSAGYLQAHAVEDLALTLDGCSAANFAGRVADLSFIGTGHSRSVLGDVGDSAIILRGSARLAASDLGDGAAIQLNDFSRMRIARTGERSGIETRGSSVADIGTIGERSKLESSGRSRILSGSVGRSAYMRSTDRSRIVLDTPTINSEIETSGQGNLTSAPRAVDRERKALGLASEQ